MKRYNYALLTTTAILISFGQIYAQLSLSGEIRPRSEYRHGYRTLIDSTQDGGFFTSQRTRLNFNYKHEKLITEIVLQDVRTWGNQSQLNTYDVNTSSLHQAWGEYLFTDNFSVKAGRQEIGYDDERLLGSATWTQQGRSHDAMLLKYQNPTFSVHVGAAYNQTGENNVATPYTGLNNYKEMYYVWLNKKINNFRISILELNNGFQSTAATNSTRFSYTTGTHLEFNKKDTLLILGRFYYQGGIDAQKKNISSCMGGLEGTYIIQIKSAITLGVEILSGQSQTDTVSSYTDTQHNFNPLYGTGHKFNGYMDYFYAGSGHENIGLNNFYLKFKYTSQKWWATFDVHQFMANAEVLNTENLTQTGEIKKMDNNLGTELDLTIAYLAAKNFTIQAGYSQLFATKTMEAIKGGDYKITQNWAYLMLIFKPVFIK